MITTRFQQRRKTKKATAELGSAVVLSWGEEREIYGQIDRYWVQLGGRNGVLEELQVSEIRAQGIEIVVVQEIVDAGDGSTAVVPAHLDDTREIRDPVVESQVDHLDERRGQTPVVRQDVQPVLERLHPLLRRKALEVGDLRSERRNPCGHARMPGSRGPQRMVLKSFGRIAALFLRNRGGHLQQRGIPGSVVVATHRLSPSSLPPAPFRGPESEKTL